MTVAVGLSTQAAVNTHQAPLIDRMTRQRQPAAAARAVKQATNG